MRRASLSRGRGLVALKARGGKTRGLNAPDDMAILHIELEDIEPLIWRRVAVPVSMNLEVVHSVIQAAVRWLIQSTLITLIRLRLRSPQPAASGQNGWAHDWFAERNWQTTIDYFLSALSRTLERNPAGLGCAPEPSPRPSG